VLGGGAQEVENAHANVHTIVAGKGRCLVMVLPDELRKQIE
jgi:hypothetical protein